MSWELVLYGMPLLIERFKEIDLSEKQGTGITKILSAIHQNGSMEPEYEMDEDRVYFAATIRIREGFEYLEGDGDSNNLDIEEAKVQRLKPESLNYAIRKYNKPTKDKILAVYENTEMSQIICVSEVRRILDCPESTAKDLIKKMRAVDILVPIKGHGKGKYQFIFDSGVIK